MTPSVTQALYGLPRRREELTGVCVVNVQAVIEACVSARGWQLAARKCFVSGPPKVFSLKKDSNHQEFSYKSLVFSNII